MAFRSDYIWFNGEFVPWDDATVHVGVHALHYGSSVFEGIRAYSTPKGPAVFRLKEHVQRFIRSPKPLQMELPFSQEELEQAILDTIARNGHDSCYIRPLAFRGMERLGVDGRSCPVEVVIMTWEWGQYLGPEAITEGVEAGVSSWRRMAPDTFPANCKIGGQYVNSQFITMEAKDRGFVEGIALDINGFVSEGSGENIFMLAGGKLYTPPLSASILDGITRNSVITLAKDMGYEVVEEMIPRERLYAADEVFFTGTAAEITPVRLIDGLTVGAGRRGPVTAELQDRFFAITKGEAPDQWGWLTYVNK